MVEIRHKNSVLAVLSLVPVGDLKIKSKEMAKTYMSPSSSVHIPNSAIPFKSHNSPNFNKFRILQTPSFVTSNTHLNPLPASTKNTNQQQEMNEKQAPIPSMLEIMEASKTQNIDINLQTIGPFFRITAKSLKTKKEIGKAEGWVRVWLPGKILHLDSIRLGRETLSMERSIFGIGLFIGAVAIRHGYDCGCATAQLLAINDSDLYHSKLVRFYTRMGFKTVHEVDGSSTGDLIHMLAWGGKGTLMDAKVEELLIKWSRRFKAPN